MRWLVEIVGDLYGERAAQTEFRHQRREERFVVRNPLQHRIGEDHIERRFRAPFANVGDLEGNESEDACAPPGSCRGRS